MGTDCRAKRLRDQPHGAFIEAQQAGACCLGPVSNYESITRPQSKLQNHSRKTKNECLEATAKAWNIKSDINEPYQEHHRNHNHANHKASFKPQKIKGLNELHQKWSLHRQSQQPPKCHSSTAAQSLNNYKICWVPARCIKTQQKPTPKSFS